MVSVNQKSQNVLGVNMNIEIHLLHDRQSAFSDDICDSSRAACIQDSFSLSSSSVYS